MRCTNSLTLLHVCTMVELKVVWDPNVHLQPLELELNKSCASIRVVYAQDGAPITRFPQNPQLSMQNKELLEVSF